MKLKHIILFFLCVALLASCSSTKSLHGNQYLYKGSDIIIKSIDSTGKIEKKKQKKFTRRTECIITACTQQQNTWHAHKAVDF